MAGHQRAQCMSSATHNLFTSTQDRSSAGTVHVISKAYLIYINTGQVISRHSACHQRSITYLHQHMAGHQRAQCMSSATHNLFTSTQDRSSAGTVHVISKAYLIYTNTWQVISGHSACHQQRITYLHQHRTGHQQAQCMSSAKHNLFTSTQGRSSAGTVHVISEA